MSTTMIRQIMNSEVDERLDDPQWLAILSEYRRKIRSGFFDEWWLDVVFQKSWHSPLDMVDVCVFADIHAAIHCKWVLTAEVELGVEPRGDTEDEYHNGILSSLSEPFFGKFSGGPGGGNDGIWGWSTPIKMGQLVSDGRGGGKSFSRTIGPTTLPLEVGYTDSCTTLLHLMQSWGVARWPYGSTKVFLLYKYNRNYLTSGLKVPYPPKRYNKDKPIRKHPIGRDMKSLAGRKVW